MMKHLLLAAVFLAAVPAATFAVEPTLNWGIGGPSVPIEPFGRAELAAFDTNSGVIFRFESLGIYGMPGGGLTGMGNFIAEMNGSEIFRAEMVPVSGRFSFVFNDSFVVFSDSRSAGSLGETYSTRSALSLSFSGAANGGSFSFSGSTNTVFAGGAFGFNGHSAATGSLDGVIGTFAASVPGYRGSGFNTVDSKGFGSFFLDSTVSTFQDLSGGSATTWRGDAVVSETDPMNIFGAPIVTPGGATNVFTDWYVTGEFSPGTIVSSASNPDRGYSGSQGSYTRTTVDEVFAAIGTGNFQGLLSTESSLVFSNSNARGSALTTLRATYRPLAISQFLAGADGF